MKRSDVEKELKELKSSRSYMQIYNTGRGEYRGEVDAKIEIYERLLIEGYETKATKSKSSVTLTNKDENVTFKVPDNFLSILRQVAKNRGVKSPTVFKELVELMTEELYRELD